MFRTKKWTESSKQVRDAYENVERCMLDELAKPGMTSNERESVIGDLRRAHKDLRSWEEHNEFASIKRGEAIGMIKAAGFCLVGFLGGLVTVTIKNII